jgi:hypothetical protein
MSDLILTALGVPAAVFVCILLYVALGALRSPEQFQDHYAESGSFRIAFIAAAIGLPLGSIVAGLWRWLTTGQDFLLVPVGIAIAFGSVLAWLRIRAGD